MQLPRLALGQKRELVSRVYCPGRTVGQSYGCSFEKRSPPATDARGPACEWSRRSPSVFPSSCTTLVADMVREQPRQLRPPLISAAISQKLLYCCLRLTFTTSAQRSAKTSTLSPGRTYVLCLDLAVGCGSCTAPGAKRGRTHQLWNIPFISWLGRQVYEESGRIGIAEGAQLSCDGR